MGSSTFRTAYANSQECTLIDKYKQNHENLGLTAKGRHQGEEHHSPCQQIQAASLISEGPPVDLQGQTYVRAHCAAHHSC